MTAQRKPSSAALLFRAWCEAAEEFKRLQSGAAMARCIAARAAWYQSVFGDVPPLPRLVTEATDESDGACMSTRSTRTKTTKTPPTFPDGTAVRARGTFEEQLQLHGRMVAGAVGTIVKPARRSHGINRYLVHFPRHIYVTPVKRMESPIEAHDTVLREDQIEAVPADELPRRCRVCGCTDEWGCDEGCEWVEADLCSSCAGAQDVQEVSA